METFFIETVAYLHLPSKEAHLVIFMDDSIRETKGEVNKHLQQCISYAQTNHVYLVTSLLVHDNNLCLCLISPEGELLCRQAANHLTDTLRDRLQCGEVQHVVRTPLVNITLCVDVDIYYPQVLRTAALKDAELAISIQNLQPIHDTYSRIMATAWNAAQTNNLYVFNHSGNSCTVACPSTLNRSRDGYLVRRTSIVPMRCGLNLRRLHEVQNTFPLMDALNRELVTKHLDALGRW